MQSWITLMRFCETLKDLVINTASNVVLFPTNDIYDSFTMSQTVYFLKKFQQLMFALRSTYIDIRRNGMTLTNQHGMC